MPSTLQIDYVFKFSEGRERHFATELDFQTLAIVPKPAESLPDWTMLAFHQCAGCPLSPAAQPRCPVAVNLVEIVEFFKACISYEEVQVTVVTDARTFVKNTSVEEGLASLLEIYLGGSGCPVMDKARPALIQHVPFASPVEATYRYLTTFLASQYFLSKSGAAVDGSIARLSVFLNEMQQVNAAFLQRLKAVEEKDALRNAMVVINNLAAMAARAISENKLQRVEGIFLAASK